MAGNLTPGARHRPVVTTAVANGDLSQKITVDAKGEILQLKDTINKMVDQLNSFAARGDARGPRGRHRGQAGRAGRGQGGGRHVERADGQRQRHGRQPDLAGARHRPRRHRHRQRRPVPEDHRGRQGRDPATEGHHQQDGGQPQHLRRRSDARGQGGRHRGQARRPGQGQGRGRHLEGPDRQRQLPWPAASPRRCATSPA